MKINELNIEIGVNLAISEETAKACLGIVQMYCNNTNHSVDAQISIDTDEVLLLFKKRK